MRVQLFVALVVGLLALGALGLVKLRLPTESAASEWDPAATPADTRELKAGEDITGQRIRFVAPTVVCRSKDLLFAYLDDLRAGDRAAAQVVLADPDVDEERYCGEMDGSNNFRVIRTWPATDPDRPMLLELDGGERSLWSGAGRVRVIVNAALSK